MRTLAQTDRKNWRRLTVLQLSPIGWVLLAVVTARLPDRYWVPILLLSGLGLLYTGHFIDNWPCPRCKMRFHRKGRYGVITIFRFQCANCGLRRG